jgi:GNAT superfamily N-acetyltransferase
MQTKNASTYDLAPLANDAERIRNIAALLRAAFGDASRFTERYLRWQYEENPDGAAVGFDAFAGDDLAAHYVALPLRARLFGETAKGLLSLNTATSPAYQGKGLFTRLACATYERARELGYEFVVGVANANSTHGFVKKLGFQLVCPLDVRVGIGRPQYDDTGASHFRRIWSEQSMDWRLRNPATAYAFRAGAFWADPGMPGTAIYLGKAFQCGSSLSKRPAAHPLTAWIGLAPNARWRGVALPVPQRMRPSPLNLIFRDLTPAGRTLDASRVFFEALDFDAY